MRRKVLHTTNSHAGCSQTTRLIEQALLKKYAPTSVVVNTEGEIVYVNGHTGTYLNLVDGQTSLNILKMIDEAVRAELAGALLESATSRTDIVLPPHRITINRTRKRVVLHVSPLPGSAALLGMVIVEFRPSAACGKRHRSKRRSEAPFSRPLNRCSLNSSE